MWDWSGFQNFNISKMQCHSLNGVWKEPPSCTHFHLELIHQFWLVDVECRTLTPGHDPVQKVTLIPRGQARGLTWFIPGEDPTLISRQQIFARIVGALGGRAAEEIVFGDAEVTTGASSDLQQVSSMAKQVFTYWTPLHLVLLACVASRWINHLQSSQTPDAQAELHYKDHIPYLCSTCSQDKLNLSVCADGDSVWHVRYWAMGFDGPISTGWWHDHAHDGS